jgi:hypothetical protein
MLSFKILVDKFKALSTIKKVLLVLVILIIVFGIVSIFSKSSFGSVQASSVFSTKYTPQTGGMSQSEFDSYIATQYQDLNLGTSTKFVILNTIYKLVPLPSIDGAAASAGNLTVLNDTKQTPASSIQTAISQAGSSAPGSTPQDGSYTTLMNNLIKDLTAAPNVWMGSKTQKILTGMTQNYKNSPSASETDVAADLQNYQLKLMTAISSYLSGAAQPNYQPLPSNVKL